MLIAQLTEKMIQRSKGNLHDINHFLKVYAYARTIGIREGLPAETQTILEAAALVHDIACPLCREKYGNTNGKHQEREGMVLAEEFLRDSGLSREARVLSGGPPPHAPGGGWPGLPDPVGGGLSGQRRRGALLPGEHPQYPG